MKKFFKVFLKILIILVCLWIVLKVHNTIILKKIHDKIEIANNSEYFYRVMDSTASGLNHQEVYIHGDRSKQIQKSTNYENTLMDRAEFLRIGDDMYMSQIMKDPTADKVLVISLGNTMLGSSYRILGDGLAISMLNGDFTFSKVLKNFISPTVLYSGKYEGEKCYIIKSPLDTTYINKETGLPIAVNTKGVKENSLNMIGLSIIAAIYNQEMGGFLLPGDAVQTKYEYSLEPFDDSILDFPDFSQYDQVVFAGGLSSDSKNFNKTENAISGTELEPGERLITNITLNEDEKLDYYGLENKEGASGIKNRLDKYGYLEIYELKVYNKIREEVYKNLPELTEDDFKDYIVSILYKTGYQLSFEEMIAGSENGCFKNYLLSEKESSEPSLLFIIRPATELFAPLRLNNLNALEKISEIKVSAEDALAVATDNFELIKEKLQIADIYKIADELINIDFSKVNIEVELGEVPTDVTTCWQFECNDGEGNLFYIVINAISGEIIGVIK